MMDQPLFASLALFSVAMSITPGPNNLLLAASGLSFGFRRTLPTLLGTLIGIGSLFIVSGAGVGALILSSTYASDALRFLGAAYLIYLAWCLWRSSTLKSADTDMAIGLWRAAAFQFVNPKAWMMTVSAVSIYVSPAPDYWPRLLTVTLTFLIISTPSVTIWAAFGAGLKAALRTPEKLKLFNRAMAVLTALSAVVIIFWRP